MAEKLLTEKDGSVPPLLPLTLYQCAPFFVDEDLFHNRLSAIFGPGPAPVTAEPFLVEPEFAPVDQSPVVVPDSVLRLRIERGDFPFCLVDFLAPSGFPDDWEEWTDHVLSTPNLKARLQSAGLYRAVDAFQSMKLQKNVPALLTLISRWSIDTHTFVASWGEFTITLEDICQLTGLEPLGRNSMSTQLSIEEADIVNTLQRWYSECASYRGTKTTLAGSKSSYVQWQRYIFRDVEKAPVGKPFPKDYVPKIVASNHQSNKAFLAAYLVAFLSRFLLTGKPADCPSKLLFVVAARLSLGKRLPLASLVLGNLYVWLDQVHLDMSRSLGRYDVANCAPAMILMAFMFERFPYFAPRANEMGTPINGFLPARICRWSGRTTNSVLSAQIDEIERFCFRPYIEGTEIFCHQFFEANPSVYQHPDTTIVDEMDRTRAHVVALVVSSYLPVLVDWGEGVTIYNPQRAARQFGYDQGVPQHTVAVAPGAPMTYDLAWGNFTRRGTLLRYKKHNGVRLPSVDRVGAVTEDWNNHWRRQADSLSNYIHGNPVHPPIVPVRFGDDTLRVPRKNTRTGEWMGYAAKTKKRLPEAAEIPSGIVGKSAKASEGKGKAIEGETSKSAPGSEEVFEQPADDDDDDVPLSARQMVVKVGVVEKQKKRAARSPSKPRASKKAAQVKIAAQVRQLALPIREEVGEEGVEEEGSPAEQRTDDAAMSETLLPDDDEELPVEMLSENPLGTVPTPVMKAAEPQVHEAIEKPVDSVSEKRDVGISAPSEVVAEGIPASVVGEGGTVAVSSGEGRGDDNELVQDLEPVSDIADVTGGVTAEQGHDMGERTPEVTIQSEGYSPSPVDTATSKGQTSEEKQGSSGGTLYLEIRGFDASPDVRAANRTGVTIARATGSAARITEYLVTDPTLTTAMSPPTADTPPVADYKKVLGLLPEPQLSSLEEAKDFVTPLLEEFPIFVGATLSPMELWLLVKIARRYPETFAEFDLGSGMMRTYLLNALVTCVQDFAVHTLTTVERRLPEFRKVVEDLEKCKIRVPWLVKRLVACTIGLHSRDLYDFSNAELSVQELSREISDFEKEETRLQEEIGILTGKLEEVRQKKAGVFEKVTIAQAERAKAEQAVNASLGEGSLDFITGCLGENLV